MTKMIFEMSVAFDDNGAPTFKALELPGLPNKECREASALAEMACNTHADLVAALTEARDALNGYRLDKNRPNPRIEKINAVLAKATAP